MKVNSRFVTEGQEQATLPGALASPEKPFNICGLLVHASVANIERVKQDLSALAGVEVHAQTEEGQLVVTIEDTEETLAAEMITQVDRLKGVLNSSLVYHQFENQNSLNLEEGSS